MRRHLFAAACALLLSAGVAVTTASTADAKANIKCGAPTGMAMIDPIVNHNQPASMHMHQFFGNTSWLSGGNLSAKAVNALGYSDLAGRGTSCENSSDTAAYWQPVLSYKNGQPVPVQAFRAYYRSWDFGDFGEGRAFPADTRLVSAEHNWTCGQFATVNPQPSIPSCAGQSGRPGHTLTSHIDFPTCWNGVLPNHKASDVGDTSDNKNYAFRSGKSCPAGFPIKMVALRQTVMYAYTGNGSDLVLASDMMAKTSGGQSMHADFWNTWVQSGLESMVRNCVNAGGHYTSAECDT